MIWGQQALKALHSEPVHVGNAASHLPQRSAAEMPPATSAAYVAGMKALLAHEASVQRGAVAIRCMALRFGPSRLNS